MVSPIGSATGGGFPDDGAIRNTVHTSNTGSDAVQPETGEQAVHKLERDEHPPLVKNPGEDRNGRPQAKKKEEIRKMTIENGKVTVNVYDEGGKLLRKTPPGFLPAGSQGFNITV